MVSRYSIRLTRSSVGQIGGVCEGLGTSLGISPIIVRLIWVAAVFIGGTGVALYLLLWWLLPVEDDLNYEPTIWRSGPDGNYRPPLERTHYNRKILGICGGLARRWDMDPTLIRLLGVALAIASLGVAIIVYLIAAIIVPNASNNLGDSEQIINL